MFDININDFNNFRASGNSFSYLVTLQQAAGSIRMKQYHM
jgi:hypothetical protein